MSRCVASCLALVAALLLQPYLRPACAARPQSGGPQHNAAAARAGDEGAAAALRFLYDFMPPEDRGALKRKWLEGQVELALKARNDTAWAREVPWDIFLDNVSATQLRQRVMLLLSTGGPRCSPR